MRRLGLATDGPGLRRRDFLIAAGAGSVGLAVGAFWPRVDGGTSRKPGPWIWVEIPPEVAGATAGATVVLPRCEMGQGSMTALAMIVAEELDLDWSTVRTVWAPPEPEYGPQVTFGSHSVSTLWAPLREAGAAARALLVEAAASRWQVAAASCETELGRVHHPATGRSNAFGELVVEAAALPVPSTPQTKAPDEFRVVGTDVERLDVPDKVIGRARFGIDIVVPGMKTAAIVHSPVLGGSLADAGAGEALRVAGVSAVVPIGSPPNAVAVVADGFHAAERGARALKPVWSDPPEEPPTPLEAWNFIERGRPEAALEDSERRHAATYEAPLSGTCDDGAHELRRLGRGRSLSGVGADAGSEGRASYRGSRERVADRPRAGPSDVSGRWLRATPGF